MTTILHEPCQVTTDDTLRETVAHGNEAYPFAYYLENIREFDFHCLDWHWHHEVEFLIVTEGSLLCLVGEDRIELQEGSGLFINSGVLHRFEAPKGTALTPNIVFSPTLIAAQESLIYRKYVLPVIHSSAAYQILKPGVEWQDEILAVLLMIFRLQESGKGQELKTVQMILKMWNLLFDSFDTGSAVCSIRRTDHRQAKLRIMMQYIHDHYREPVALEEIAAAASVSKSRALQIFQTTIQVSPVAYLIRYRLKCAGQLLDTTERSVSAIAEETGFSSAGYFCRRFKERYHKSPNEYRAYRHSHITEA